MIVRTKQDSKYKEIEVLVCYEKENRDVRRLLSAIHSAGQQVHCMDEYREKLVEVSDIYYIESVDKKTFVYLEKDVLRCDQRLYQLYETLKNAGFVQISKSCILNLNMLQSIQPLMNSRMEALLSNGEKVYVTRKYLTEIRRALQEEKA